MSSGHDYEFTCWRTGHITSQREQRVWKSREWISRSRYRVCETTARIRGWIIYARTFEEDEPPSPQTFDLSCDEQAQFLYPVVRFSDGQVFLQLFGVVREDRSLVREFYAVFHDPSRLRAFDQTGMWWGDAVAQSGEAKWVALFRRHPSFKKWTAARTSGS